METLKEIRTVIFTAAATVLSLMGVGMLTHIAPKLSSSATAKLHACDVRVLPKAEALNL